jgi:hypothetical protein
MGRPSAREKLLDCAERLFAEHGLEGVSLRAINAEAGLPLADFLAEGVEPGLRYLRFIHRLQADGDLDPHFVVERWPGGVERLVPLLRRANPSLPLSVVQLRLGLVIDVMLRRLAHGTPSMEGSLEAHVSSLLDFLTGAMQAAVTGESS